MLYEIYSTEIDSGANRQTHKQEVGNNSIQVNLRVVILNLVLRNYNLIRIS